MSKDDSTLTGSAVKEVAALQARAMALDVVTASGENRGKYYLRNPDGTVSAVYPDQPYVSDLLATPQELVAYVGKRANHSKGIAIVTPSQVGYRFDFDNPAMDRAEVPLRFSAAWKAIAAMVGNNYSGQVMTHMDLYRLLRVTLRGCLPAGSNLATLVRTMKWTTDGQISATLEQSKKMLGASMAHAVAAGVELVPESFTVTVNVYDNFVSPKQIVIDLDTIPEHQQFRLTPYPGSIETAQMQTLDAIRDLFAVGDSQETLCEAYIGA